jgi:hypothetical protein
VTFGPLGHSATAAGLLGSLLWYRPGLCQCWFRIGCYKRLYRALHRPFFSGQSRIYLPAIAVLLPSQAGSLTASHLRWGPATRRCCRCGGTRSLRCPLTWAC